MTCIAETTPFAQLVNGRYYQNQGYVSTGNFSERYFHDNETPPLGAGPRYWYEQKAAGALQATTIIPGRCLVLYMAFIIST